MPNQKRVIPAAITAFMLSAQATLFAQQNTATPKFEDYTKKSEQEIKGIIATELKSSVTRDYKGAIILTIPDNEELKSQTLEALEQLKSQKYNTDQIFVFLVPKSDKISLNYV